MAGTRIADCAAAARAGRAAMTARLDPRVAELARESGRWVSEQEGGFSIGGSDVHLVVTDVEGTLTVEAFERGASNGVELVTEDDDVLQRFLVTWLLDIWRSTHDLGFLPTSGAREAPGYDVVDDGNPLALDSRIRRRSDGAIVAREMLGIDAQALVVTLPHTLDDVLAAARDRAGAPVWAEGATLAAPTDGEAVELDPGGCRTDTTHGAGSAMTAQLGRPAVAQLARRERVLGERAARRPTTSGCCRASRAWEAPGFDRGRRRESSRPPRPDPPTLRRERPWHADARYRRRGARRHPPARRSATLDGCRDRTGLVAWTHEGTTKNAPDPRLRRSGALSSLSQRVSGGGLEPPRPFGH